MSVKYKLVLKKDLTKGAATDAKRYYASANVTGMMDFDTICDVVADRSTASDGDVALVLLGLIRCMQEALLHAGSVVAWRSGPIGCIGQLPALTWKLWSGKCG